MISVSAGTPADPAATATVPRCSTLDARHRPALLSLPRDHHGLGKDWIDIITALPHEHVALEESCIHPPAREQPGAAERQAMAQMRPASQLRRCRESALAGRPRAGGRLPCVHCLERAGNCIGQLGGRLLMALGQRQIAARRQRLHELPPAAQRRRAFGI